jgi:hypothetical protein
MVVRKRHNRSRLSADLVVNSPIHRGTSVAKVLAKQGSNLAAGCQLGACSRPIDTDFTERPDDFGNNANSAWQNEISEKTTTVWLTDDRCLLILRVGTSEKTSLGTENKAHEKCTTPRAA